MEIHHERGYIYSFLDGAVDVVQDMVNAALKRDDKVTEVIQQRHPDGEKIIYINLSYPPELSTLSGKLVHDILTIESKDMLLDPFKSRTRYLKQTEEGRAKVGSVVRELRIEGGVDFLRGVMKYGIPLTEEVIRKVALDQNFSEDEAEEIVKKVMACA